MSKAVAKKKVTKHKTLGEMLLSGGFAKPAEQNADDQDWQRILDEAGYGLPDGDKPKAELTTGLLGHLTQSKPKKRIETLWDALDEM